MEFEAAGMGRMVLNVQTIRHTAAVVRVGVKRGGRRVKPWRERGGGGGGGPFLPGRGCC